MSTPPAVSAAAPRAIVVDDAPEVRLLLEAYLRALGFSVTTLDSGQHALATVRRVLPQLVLLDIMLPNTCGLDLCEAITRDPGLRQVSVIVTSARTMPRDRANAELAGAAAFLPKPVAPAELAAAVARVVLLTDPQTT